MEKLPDGIQLEFEVFDALRTTLKRDTRVLESFKIMDYRFCDYIAIIFFFLRLN